LTKSAGEAENIARDFVSQSWPNTVLNVTSVAFDGNCFVVRGQNETVGLIDVKIDREGNVVGWSANPSNEPT
jgi:hypothetical protein